MSIFDNFSQFVGDYGTPLYMLGQAGSVYARNQAARAVMGRQQQLLDTERARQAVYGQQAHDVFAKQAMPNFTPPAAEARRAGEQGKEEALAKSTVTPSSVFANYNASTGNASSKDSIASRLTEAMSKGANYASTGAKMRSYGSGINLGNLKLEDTGQQLGRIGRNSQISASLLPGELDYASAYTGRDARTASDLLGGAGAIAGLYSLTRPKKVPDTGAGRTYMFGGGGNDMSAQWPAGV